jgi:1-acyl-sn-glycerol-3-phosphate acyltransferase
MTILRSLLYLSFMAVTVILYATPITLLGWLVPYHVVAKAGQNWALVNLWALRMICGLGYRVRGWENLPKGSCVVLCNHQSTWETIALRGLLPPEHTWVLKRELLRVPFFGWALAKLRPIAIDRSSGLQSIRQLLKEGKYWLEKGHWIVIFPEGTRVAPGEHMRYSQGGAMLAQKAGYPVLPIAHNAGVFWRRREIKKYPGSIDLVIGEPLNTKDLSIAEINRQVETWIENTVATLPQERS